MRVQREVAVLGELGVVLVELLLRDAVIREAQPALFADEYTDHIVAGLARGTRDRHTHDRREFVYLAARRARTHAGSLLVRLVEMPDDVQGPFAGLREDHAHVFAEYPHEKKEETEEEDQQRRKRSKARKRHTEEERLHNNHKQSQDRKQ